MKQILFCLAAFVLAWTACKTSTAPASKEVAYINPPIPALDPKFQTFTIEVSKGGSYTSPLGTHITVPANALTDADGKVLSGSVELRYREFQDAGDVYLSGIPMRYDSAGQHTTLTTAGMFELRASDATVKVAKSAKINVKFASYTDGNTYNAYFLDEQNKNWSYIDYNRAVVNSEKVALKQKIVSMEPKLPFPLGKQYFCLDYNGIVDVVYNNNWSAVDDKLVKSKADAYGLAYLNTLCYDGINIKGVSYPASMGVWKRLGSKPFPSYTTDRNKHSCRVKHLSGSEYEITYYNGRYWDTPTDSTKMRVQYVMSLFELFKFGPDYWKNNFQVAMQRIEKERERLRTMANMYRELKVTGFGIYNYDKIMKMPDNLLVKADFKFEGNYDKEVSDINQVIFVPSDSRSIVKLDKDMWPNMPLAPDEGGRIFALLPDNKIALYDQAKYAAIDFNKLKTSNAISFEMLTQAQTINSAEDLKKLLGIDAI